MRYDLIINGETYHAQRAAFHAARANRLVALIRTNPFRELIFHHPLDLWNWGNNSSWKNLQEQFLTREGDLNNQYLQEGIELLEGQTLEIEEHSLVISTRGGRLIDLNAEEILNFEPPDILLPAWLQTEVPHVTPLPGVSRLSMLPESVLIEGNSLPALRFAVMCARLNRKVAVSSSGWNAPDFQFELSELEDEAFRRGVLRVDQQEMLSISEQSPGEFDFWLMNGQVYRTGLYVFATENVSTMKEPHFIARMERPLNTRFPVSVF